MIKTPCCPECGEEPAIILDGGHQAFCPTEWCIIITWDQHKTAEENQGHVIDLDLGE